jgi:hypothetical protein
MTRDGRGKTGRFLVSPAIAGRPQRRNFPNASIRIVFRQPLCPLLCVPHISSLLEF